ncbi:MAG: glutamate--tRNA ligase [Rickettsiales bacterium]|nr:glutamate--tRNA ligase [Rickettsiales bacterium]|tara:strand:+ start:5536 stop:6924 length:1389 start_codon:yes stop_codon:yes gene_type:complete
MTVITRIAPSPTGDLHIGTARTALFNWLWAQHTQGQFLIRVEDTDQKRHSDNAVQTILEGLNWLGLNSSAAPTFQSQRQARHIEVAQQLYQSGHAYYCTCTPEDVEAMREQARKNGQIPKYNGRCRNASHTQGVLRFKMPTSGQSTLHDQVQGTITIDNSQFDDFVLLRADGTPTYLLAVVVDDHDMYISHVIRGDDHINNTFKQVPLYQAMGWDVPAFAHIPLIHGPDGHKFSKRHGAPSILAYRDQGFLPQAMFNYLLKLGWSHGDDEIISQAQAIKWFSLDNLNKSPARFDMEKLRFINTHYLRAMDPSALMQVLAPFLEKQLGRPLNSSEADRIQFGLPHLTQRAETLVELADTSLIYTNSPPTPTETEQALLTPEALKHLNALKEKFTALEAWNKEALTEIVKIYLADHGLKMPEIGKPLRVALTGRLNAPGLYDILETLGHAEALSRLNKIAPPSS